MHPPGVCTSSLSGKGGGPRAQRSHRSMGLPRSAWPLSPIDMCLRPGGCQDPTTTQIYIYIYIYISVVVCNIFGSAKFSPPSKHLVDANLVSTHEASKEQQPVGVLLLGALSCSSSHSLLFYAILCYNSNSSLV